MSPPIRDSADRSPTGDPAAPVFELTLHGIDDPRRAAVEAFISGVYARCYGAMVPHFAPMLVGLRENGELLAAAGYRSAAHEPLYLECYLPAPVEAIVAARIGERPARSDIVEVGHLAANRGGEGRRLVQLLALHLAAEGFDWVVGTVTRELKPMLERLGAAPVTLGAADPASLGDQAAHWGRYYEHQPVVLATHLQRDLQRHRARRAAAAGGDR
ncbi:thermostable hemolysin [Variovorax rhizosphaerae]|uniref:Thermostable hemolysin n=1 Tax=Variovorax rhizosphaerae TaxID=1836200 RepID=A0ABU8WQZ3_9BURK